MLADNAYVCYSNDMKGRHVAVAASIAIVVLGLWWVIAANLHRPVLLEPSGTVGVQQRDLLVLSSAVMAAIALPVFGLLIYISRTYRATNRKAIYMPNHASNNWLEALWWGIPIAVVVVLSVMAWQTSHTLDPYRPLVSDAPAYRVQVVALQWKWLFLYPEQQTASVNELVIPVGQPVEFTITSDAPMNSFWIPELGGQIYAMSGMSTKLHLQADKPGNFQGVSSNISGAGFADMKFVVRAMSEADLSRWHYDAVMSEQHLDHAAYTVLATPSVPASTTKYRLDEAGLYNMIIDKYSAGHDMKKVAEPMTHGGMH